MPRSSSSRHGWLRWRRSRVPFHRGLWLAWGLASQFTAESFATKAAAAGYAWAALELDDYGNAVRWPSFRNACANRGIIPGVWFTEGGNIAQTPLDAGFVIAECEGPGDYDGIVREQGALPSTLPKAIATNFNIPLTDASGVPQPDNARPLIEAGWVCLTECYLSDNPHATPDEMDFRARQLGWPSSQPIFGTYGGKTVADYAEWADWPGWSAYLAEYILLS